MYSFFYMCCLLRASVNYSALHPASPDGHLQFASPRRSGPLSKEVKYGKIKEDYKHVQVTCSWGVEKHTYHTNCGLALHVGQVEYLCFYNIDLWQT